jgi:hypothetical protein
MLGIARYLLGVAEILLLAGFATLGASRLRARLLPGWQGAPARLATAVLALATLVLVAELLGSFGLFEAVPYLLAIGAIGLGMWAYRPAGPVAAATRGRGVSVASLIALAIAAVAVIHFAAGVRLRLSTGMTGFDSTWYHGPFAAGFFQSGNTWGLHFIAPQFLAWFYPANSELLHAVGMLAFHRDLLSMVLNLGWFAGCLFAAWCIGRPYGVAPFSLGLAAVALSVPALSDQAGEARNDLFGIFFLLAAIAIPVNVRSSRLPAGALIVSGLAAGLAAGTKLNFLLPAAVLVVGLAAIAPRGARLRSLAATGLAALVGGGYWYLRNLAHSGNPLPWVRHLGPISLPAPAQALGGREGHSVLSYLTDGSVWSEWFLPGLHHGLWILWPLLLGAALAALLLCAIPPLNSLRCGLSRNRADNPQRNEGGVGEGWRGEQRRNAVLAVAGWVGLAAVLAWLIAPTSASGPAGMPRGFESGLRYLAPALILGLALLPATPPLRRRLARLSRSRSSFEPHSDTKLDRAWRGRVGMGVGAALLVLGVAFGYWEQRRYLEHRYARPEFTSKGLDAAFKWARSISGARIATTSTRQYPLYGTDLSNRVQYIGVQTPHGGFVAPTTCPQWRRLLNEGHYDYAVVTRDRIEPGQPAFPPAARWTEGPGTKVILRRSPTVVYRLTHRLNPTACP